MAKAIRPRPSAFRQAQGRPE